MWDTVLKFHQFYKLLISICSKFIVPEKLTYIFFILISFIRQSIKEDVN